MYAPMIRSFVYRALVSCNMHSFRVSCVFRIVRVKRLFVFRSFRLRFVRIVNLYDPGSVAGFSIFPVFLFGGKFIFVDK